MKHLPDKVGALVLLNVIKYAIGFLVPVLLVRFLTKTEYGSYQQLLLLGQAMVSIFTLSLPNSLTYFYRIVTHTERRALLPQTILTLVASGTIGALVLYLFRGPVAASFNNEALVDLLPSYCWYLVFYIASEYIIHFLIGKDQYPAAVAIQSSETVVRAIIISVPVILSPTLPVLVASMVAYAVLRFVVFGIVVRDDLRVSGRVLENTFVRRQLAYSVPLALTRLVGLIGLVFDRLIIAFNFDPARFAVYAVGAIEIPTNVIFQASVQDTLRAELPALVQRGEYAKIAEICKDFVRRLALIILPIFMFLMVFAGLFVTILFTDAYSESVTVFRIYLCMMPLHIFVMSLVPQIFGKTHINFRISTTIVVAHVMFSLIFLKVIGYYGPAISSAVVSYVGTYLYLRVIKSLLGCRVFDVIPVDAIVRISALTTVCAAIGYGVASLLDFAIAKFVAGGIVYCVLYLIAIPFVGLLSQEDKEHLRRWLLRLGIGGRLFGRG